MADKLLEQTQNALEDLVKVEYQAIAAYEEALGETEDSKLRRQYSRFLADHEKQARALNNRLVELGGEPIEYGAGSGKVKAGLWGKITGLFGDAASLGGMVKGAEQGIHTYLDHLDEIHDSKALNIVRRNLEAKQHEVRWLEEQEHKESSAQPSLPEKARSAAADLSKKPVEVVTETKAKVEEAAHPKRTGFLGLPVWLLLAAGAAAAFVFLRRQEEPDFSDEAFEYETTDFGDLTAGQPDGEGYHGIAETGTPGASNNA